MYATISQTTSGMMKSAISVRRFCEEMKLQAIGLVMHVEESGPKKQTKLTEELGTGDCTMSRLLAKLELHHQSRALFCLSSGFQPLW
jgi:hypothetical protein